MYQGRIKAGSQHVERLWKLQAPEMALFISPQQQIRSRWSTAVTGPRNQHELRPVGL